MRWEVASSYGWAARIPSDKVKTFLKVPVSPTGVQLKIQNPTLQKKKSVPEKNPNRILPLSSQKRFSVALI